MTTRTDKEYYVRQTTFDGGFIWKTDPKAKVAFYGRFLNGDWNEAHAVVAEAFGLKGFDRVWVRSEDGGVCDVVVSVERVAA